MHQNLQVDDDNDLNRRTFDELPWKVSPNWLDFLKIAIGRIGAISPDVVTQYSLGASAYQIGKIGFAKGLHWTFYLTDHFTGRVHKTGWNGKNLDEDSITS